MRSSSPFVNAQGRKISYKGNKYLSIFNKPKRIVDHKENFIEYKHVRRCRKNRAQGQRKENRHPFVTFPDFENTLENIQTSQSKDTKNNPNREKRYTK